MKNKLWLTLGHLGLVYLQHLSYGESSSIEHREDHFTEGKTSVLFLTAILFEILNQILIILLYVNNELRRKSQEFTLEILERRGERRRDIIITWKTTFYIWSLDISSLLSLLHSDSWLLHQAVVQCYTVV